MKKLNGMLRIVVKRKGHQEFYDRKKVYASVYAAALNCGYGERKSERIALRVMKEINVWVKTKKVIESQGIRKKVVESLVKIDKDVALMYKSHLDVC